MRGVLRPIQDMGRVAAAGLALVLLFRLLIPAGYMITPAGAGQPALVLCAAASPAAVDPAPRHGHEGHSDSAPAKPVDPPCPFAALAAPALPPSPPAAPASPTFADSADAAEAAAGRRGPGLAAPPPPATGPPPTV